MTHQPEKKGFDLFNKRKPPVYPEITLDFIQKFRNVNLLYAGSALLQTVTGLFAVTLSLLQLVQPLWATVVLALLGSMLSIAGLGLLYYTLKDKNSVERLVNQTIERIVRDCN
ncbi:MAG: hypothetical protein WD267_03350 [Balneolales bacterium]